MLVHILGFIANLLSLILWIPQARITWKNRNNPEILSGISLGTQIITSLNTISWCIYGLLTKDFWLPLGTIIILPLALMTIWFKIRAMKLVKES